MTESVFFTDLCLKRIHNVIKYVILTYFFLVYVHAIIMYSDV